MRAIVTGQVGIEKKPFVDAVAQHARNHGFDLGVFHVGDRMYAEAGDVAPGRILDLPLSRLHSLRRSVFKDIVTEAGDQPNIIVNTHATFRWRHGLFRAFDFDQIERLRPDLFVCLVDNVEAVAYRLKSEHSLDATLKDMMVWREEEILATELLALATDRKLRSVILPRGRAKATTRTAFRLICRPDMARVYLSYPMSHVADLPDVLAEIEQFRATFVEHFIAFDPGDVDEKLLLDAALQAAREGRDFVPGSAPRADGVIVPIQVSVKQILESAGDIDGQIYARDFQLIDQSDMIVSLIPELREGVPGLSSGVERELHHAYEHGKEVFVIWRSSRNPSPFITETATRVFGSVEESLEYFRRSGKLPESDSLLGP